MRFTCTGEEQIATKCVVTPPELLGYTHVCPLLLAFHLQGLSDWKGIWACDELNCGYIQPAGS